MKFKCPGANLTFTFKCDKCYRVIVCLMSKYSYEEIYGRCYYCDDGRLKYIKNIQLYGLTLKRTL